MSRRRPRNAFPIASSLHPLKCAAALTVALTIAGCSPDKPTALATCERETMRFFADSGGDDFMTACMEDKGYRFDVLPADCDSKSRMTRQPACYVPNDWFAAVLDGIGRPSKSPTAAATAKANSPAERGGDTSPPR